MIRVIVVYKLIHLKRVDTNIPYSFLKGVIGSILILEDSEYDILTCAGENYIFPKDLWVDKPCKFMVASSYERAIQYGGLPELEPSSKPFKFPSLSASQLVSVQPMTAPIGKVFYLGYVYGEKENGQTKRIEEPSEVSNSQGEETKGEEATKQRLIQTITNFSFPAIRATRYS